MFPCCGYDPGLAAYLSPLDAQEQREILQDDVLDTRMLLGCLAVVGMVHAILLLFMVA